MGGRSCPNSAGPADPSATGGKNRGVADVGATRAGIFIHLMPVFGVILAIAFLGERLSTYHLLGFGAIFTGILLTTVRSGNSG